MYWSQICKHTITLKHMVMDTHCNKRIHLFTKCPQFILGGLNELQNFYHFKILLWKWQKQYFVEWHSRFWWNCVCTKTSISCIRGSTFVFVTFMKFFYWKSWKLCIISSICIFQTFFLELVCQNFLFNCKIINITQVSMLCS